MHQTRPSPPGDVRVSGCANTASWVLRDMARLCAGTPPAPLTLGPHPTHTQVRENPESWRHFIEYVPDEELPDEFDTIAHVQRTLGALGVTGVDADVVERSMRSFHRLHSGGHG